MSRVLIIDANHMLYRSYFAYDQFSHNGQSTACIYGLPTLLRKVVSDFTPDKVYLVWDGHKKNKEIRRKIHPDYKNRDNTSVDLDDLIRQKLIVQEIISNLGVPQIMVEDMEGDDAIYALTRLIRKSYDSIILSTGDKDFNQMLMPGFNIWSENKAKMITTSNCKEVFGYEAYETVDWLILMGDSSDQIPGLRGCGKKTARDLLDRYKSVKQFMQSPDEFPRVNKEELNKIYKRNFRLINLKWFYLKHFKGKRRLTFIGKRKPKLDEDYFKRLSVKYGIRRFLDPTFIKPFKNI